MSEAQTLEEQALRPRRAHAPTVRQAGDAEELLESYLHDMRRFGRLTTAQELELAHHVAAGEHWARQQLIEANLPLVIAIARHCSHTGVPLLDLIQEGNPGLMRAAEKFEAGRGCRFGTYATLWIRQAVSRAATKQSHLIELPEQDARKRTRMTVLRRGAWSGGSSSSWYRKSNAKSLMHMQHQQPHQIKTQQNQHQSKTQKQNTTLPRISHPR
jgi:RNA polymerase primary sigma factor